MLIPWYIAPMRKGVDGKRTMGIYLDRVVGITGARVAWPAASFTLPRFMSDFTQVTVPDHSQSLLAITPSEVGGYANIGRRSNFDGGTDGGTKPTCPHQLPATTNPDSRTG